MLALSLLWGISCYLYPSEVLFFAAIWLIYLLVIGSSSGISLLLIGWGYAFFLYAGAPSAESRIPIEGIFCISSLQPHSSPFHKDLLYKGTLYTPHPIACSFCLPIKNRLKADKDYWVSGSLMERGTLQYTFKLKQSKPLPASRYRWAEKRYQYKERFRTFLQRTTSPKSASLLGSLITGDVEDRLLRYTFNRTGLQHLLAISGFHFALLITLLSGLFKMTLPRVIHVYFLLGALTLYFLFVGSAPAIFRSFCTAFLYFLGKILHRRSTALNLLGGAMLLELLIDPLVCSQIGFQLSFVSCASLLIFFPTLNKLLQRLLPKREISELATMSPFSSVGYLLCSFFRSSLCVTLAVNLALLPLLFTHFHTFSLLSLIYNLFFPLAISGSLFLLLISLALYLLCAPLGQFFLSVTDFWTLQLLELLSYPPLFLERCWHINDLPAWVCIGYLLVIFLGSIKAPCVRKVS